MSLVSQPTLHYTARHVTCP